MRAVAPGRVNLIGDHTDYTGGFALPMAIDLVTTVEGRPSSDRVELVSGEREGRVMVPIGEAGGGSVGPERGPLPEWGPYVAGVVTALRPRRGLVGRVDTTVPIGAGLASSAALQVAMALALGFEGPDLELALTCQRAEHVATGVRCGVMDQLASVFGTEGHALLVDCTELRVSPVAMPEDVEVVVVHSGEERRLADTPYDRRRRECEAAEGLIGPLRQADVEAVADIEDPALRARARHVVTENRRVLDFAAALGAVDLAECGHLMAASHESLRRDFQATTAVLDSLVADLMAAPGVYGARSTGAGFGGCVVALTRLGALERGWHVRAGAGARVAG